MKVVLKTIAAHRDITLLLLTMLAVKTVLLVWAWTMTDAQGNVLEIWNRWDARAYQTIAISGYDAENIAPDYRAFLSHFFPLYPLTIALAKTAFGLPALQAAMAISLISILLASFFLYRLVLHDFGNKRTAFLAVLFLNLYPLSYFTVAPYAESLFLLCVILSFFLLRQKRYLLASWAASGAFLAKVAGIALLPVYLWSFLTQPAKRKQFLFPLSAVLAAFGIYVMLNAVYFGNAFFFFTEKESFNETKRLIIPFREMASDLLTLAGHPFDRFRDQTFMMTRGWNALFTVFALLVTAYGVRKRIPIEYTVYALGSIIFFASFSWGISNARYTLPIFPMFIALALIKNRLALFGIAAVFAALLLSFTRTFTSGAWAF